MVKSLDFKIISNHEYGKNTEFTKALKSAMRHPTKSINYNGKTWAYQKGTKSCCILDRLIHKILFSISKKYKKKFYVAASLLCRAMFEFNVNSTSDHLSMITKINKLEKKRFDQEAKINEIETQVTELDQIIRRETQALEAMDRQYDEHCDKEGIPRTTPLKAQYKKERSQLNDSGIEEDWLNKKEIAERKVQGLKVELEQLEKDSKNAAFTEFSSFLKKIRLKKDEIKITTEAVDKLQEEYESKNPPSKFQGMGALELSDYFWGKQATICAVDEVLKDDPNYIQFKSRQRETASSLRAHIQERESTLQELEEAKEGMDRLDLNVRAFTEHASPKKTKVQENL